MPNYLNHDVPEYSDNYDPCPSGGNLPETSNDDDSELNTSSTEETPYVSIYGMVGAKNIHQDVEMYRATLFNLKTEPEEDRERRNQISLHDFLQRCLEPDDEEINKEDKSLNELQPEGTTKQIKIEPVDEIEEDLSFEEETEPLEYLPEIYSQTTENPYHIDTTHPRANALENIRMFLGQFGQSNEMNGLNMQPINIQPEITITEIKIEPVDEIEEDFLFEEEFEPVGEIEENLRSEEEFEPVDEIEEHLSSEDGIGPLETGEMNNSFGFVISRVRDSQDINTSLEEYREPEEMDGINMQPEEGSPIDTITNPRANELELESNRMFLQQYGEPEEMDGLNMQPEGSPIDTITNPRANELELESNRMFLQQYGEPEEMDGLNMQPEEGSPIDTITNPRANELVSNRMFLQQYGEPEEMDGLNIGQAEQPAEETPSPIDTTTNPRANELDNGNTNIMKNRADVRKRKKKEVISTPTRVSSRIKKPRIMYNV